MSWGLEASATVAREMTTIPRDGDNDSVSAKVEQAIACDCRLILWSSATGDHCTDAVVETE